MEPNNEKPNEMDARVKNEREKVAIECEKRRKVRKKTWLTERHVDILNLRKQKLKVCNQKNAELERRREKKGKSFFQKEDQLRGGNRKKALRQKILSQEEEDSQSLNQKKGEGAERKRLLQHGE